MDIYEELKKIVITKENKENTTDEEIDELLVNISESCEEEICKALANVYNAYYDDISSNGCYPIEDDGFCGMTSELADQMTEILVKYWD